MLSPMHPNPNPNPTSKPKSNLNPNPNPNLCMLTPSVVEPSSSMTFGSGMKMWSVLPPPAALLPSFLPEPYTYQPFFVLITPHSFTIFEQANILIPEVAVLSDVEENEGGGRGGGGVIVDD